MDMCLRGHTGHTGIHDDQLGSPVHSPVKVWEDMGMGCRRIEAHHLNDIRMICPDIRNHGILTAYATLGSGYTGQNTETSNQLRCTQQVP